MADIKNPHLIYLKGVIFLLCGLVAAALILLKHCDIQTAVLLFVCVWCLCRFYYFAFYVIEHYVDGKYKFAGLIDFALYLCSGRKRKSATEKYSEPDS